MKISRKLTTVLSVGGPSCTVSMCVEASDIEGLEKIVRRCLLAQCTLCIRHNKRIADIPEASYLSDGLVSTH